MIILSFWGIKMAVGKSRKSRSKRDMRRRNNTTLASVHIRRDPTTGEAHLSHFVTASGNYKGKKVIDKQD